MLRILDINVTDHEPVAILYIPEEELVELLVVQRAQIVHARDADLGREAGEGDTSARPQIFFIVCGRSHLLGVELLAPSALCRGDLPHVLHLHLPRGHLLESH